VLSGTDGQVRSVVELVPRDDRDPDGDPTTLLQLRVPS
jgi:hypothetical protein